MAERAVRMTLTGAVQGCGVRPALARMAAQYSWSGSVRNTTAGVELILAGVLPDAELLADIVRGVLPNSGVIKQLTWINISPNAPHHFQIDQSETLGSLAVPIPCDVAICKECLSEVRDPANRRYAYPFTSCTQCGPRYSILDSMPFDRIRTTMESFKLCDKCGEEYRNPFDRRFHAQTTCCSKCGPHVWATDHQGHLIATHDDAIRCAASAIRDGQIVALRGIGGYQLLVDATSPAAVAELRRRKHRPAKPLAVLCRTLADAHELASFDEIEVQQLLSPQNPIVLVRQRPANQLAPGVNPRLVDVGLLLPTTALHDRLAELSGLPLICTSGNKDGEPLAIRVDEAQQRLHGVADIYLHHDREIIHPIDDSVVRVIAGQPVTIRCARGIAPLSLELEHNLPCLAAGGNQKAAVAISNGRQSLLGPHIGDLETLAVQEQWPERVHRNCELLRVSTITHEMQLLHDPHPDYFSTQWCDALDANRTGVWHHHAHVVAGMLEHKWLNRTVLGVAFDGTGLGPDGSIWGGEFLIATATKFQRVGHLRAFGLPGASSAIAELPRIAVSILTQLDDYSSDEIARLLGLPRSKVVQLQRILDSRWTSRTTSCGRLFDAAACLILRRSYAEFEGQAAMYLEADCDLTEQGEYSFPIDVSDLVEIDWRPAFRMMISDRRSGVTSSVMATRFHRGLATAILAVCRRWPELPAVLSGGVFQNRVLVELLANQWSAGGAPLGLPGCIPPNDGGIAAGQLAVASQFKQERNCTQCALEFPVASPDGLTAIH